MTNTEPVGGASEPTAAKTRKSKATKLAETTAPTAELAPAQAPAASTTLPPATVTRRGVGGGILIGAIAASLVGGLVLGGAGGFAIAHAVGPSSNMADHGQGDGDRDGDHGLPGQPPPPDQQGTGQQGPGQQAPGGDQDGPAPQNQPGTGTGTDSGTPGN